MAPRPRALVRRLRDRLPGRHVQGRVPRGRVHPRSRGIDGANLSGSAKVASVDVKDENLAAHLQSPDFFDAERHPELGFAAERIALDGQTISVDGEITIKGVTKPVTVTGTASAPLTDPYGNERIGFTLGATVDRTEFGLEWNMPLPTGGPALADDVTIVAELQFVKAD